MAEPFDIYLDQLPPAEVARVYLRDHGWPSLAGEVGTNRVGNPTRPLRAMATDEADMVAQAMAIAHREDALDEKWANARVQFEEAIDRDVADDLPERRHWDPEAQEWCLEYPADAWARTDPDTWNRARMHLADARDIALEILGWIDEGQEAAVVEGLALSPGLDEPTVRRQVRHQIGQALVNMSGALHQLGHEIEDATR